MVHFFIILFLDMVNRPSEWVKKVKIYQPNGEFPITRTMSKTTFDLLVSSSRVAGYTDPFFGSPLIVVKPRTKYDEENEQFVERK